MRGRSAAIDKALRYVTNQYLEHIDSTSTNNTLYTEPTNWENDVMYELENAKLPKVLESLPDSFAAMLEFMKPGPPSRIVIVLEEKGKVMESTPNSKKRFICS